MKNKKIWVSLSLILFNILILACQPLFIGKEVETSWKEVTYYFNPDTILSDIGNGLNNIFFLQNIFQETNMASSETPIEWMQYDYYKVAEAFHSYAWDEKIENWKFSKMTFGMNCLEAEAGPQYANLSLYKVLASSTGQEVRLVHDIFILHEEASVRGIEAKYSPKLEEWEEINIKGIHVSADDALHIAEISGGRKARLNYSNECKVDLILAPRSEYEGWQVIYTGYDRIKIFKIYIDPITGEYSIVIDN